MLSCASNISTLELGARILCKFHQILLVANPTEAYRKKDNKIEY